MLSVTDVALRTASEALAKAACQMLEIEPGELMAEYRPSLTPKGRDGLKAEIFLYDTLPGGAGFSSQLVDSGLELFNRALTLVNTCPENCDGSCYRCLRSFKNKFEHTLLDRHVGAELLEYLLTGTRPAFDPKRVSDSTALLFSDLLRQGYLNFTFQTRVRLGAAEAPILATAKDGRRFAISLTGPLTPDHPSDSRLKDVVDKSRDTKLVLVNELVVRGNLPYATRDVYQQFSR